MNRVLIVEDEERITSFLSKGLTAEGFRPTVASSGLDALARTADGEFDLVLLDLGLPDVDGLDVLTRLRDDHPDLPVIVLTARSSVDDTVAVLEGGAADFVPKPFRFGELLARIRLRLRPTAPSAAEDSLEHAGARLDVRARRAWRGDVEVDLSAREFALAEALLRHRGQALSREQLLSMVWGYDFDPGSNVVDVYVGYLRKKLGPAFVTTIRGTGYRA